MERLFIFKFTESKEQKTKIKALPILVIRLWRSFFYKIKISNMEKHFFKRLITIIIAFAVVFLLGFLFIVIVPGNTALGIVYLMIYIISFMIVLTVLGLILDSIILYRKQQKDKAEASLFVLAIFLFVIFLIFTIFY